MIWIIIFFSCSITFAQLSTYDLIVEYEQECYSDSSLSHIYTTRNNMMFNKCYIQKGSMEGGYYVELNCDDSSHYSYVHKEPTWDGFREFVKRKYQKLFEAKK